MTEADLPRRTLEREIANLDRQCSRAEAEYPHLAAPDGRVAVPFSELRAVLNLAKRAVGEWQPIETAPRDGTPFLTYSPGQEDGEHRGFDIAGHGEDWWWKDRCGFDQVTHWKPLEAPCV